MSGRAPRRVIIVAWLLLLATPGARAGAVDRFVSIYGSDAANGYASSDDPCGTIEYALMQATDGDVVKVTRGQYIEELTIESSITLTLSGGWSFDFTSRAPLTNPSIVLGKPYFPDLLVVLAGA